ncbi:hypothetical protein [Pleomorphochaeta sp. DL1XJH-081]|uniref:hypothetical protein n=1 Tax=Pleomorphochaeta sp. DL1XJH-081 TaxID=3409690 RepID=UPI003BB7FF57
MYLDSIDNSFDSWQPYAPKPSIECHKIISGLFINADAYLKWTIMGRETMVAITKGDLDSGTWEQIFTLHSMEIGISE